VGCHVHLMTLAGEGKLEDAEFVIDMSLEQELRREADVTVAKSRVQAITDVELPEVWVCVCVFLCVFACGVGVGVGVFVCVPQGLHAACVFGQAVCARASGSVCRLHVRVRVRVRACVCARARAL